MTRTLHDLLEETREWPHWDDGHKLAFYESLSPEERDLISTAGWQIVEALRAFGAPFVELLAPIVAALSRYIDTITGGEP